MPTIAELGAETNDMVLLPSDNSGVREVTIIGKTDAEVFVIPPSWMIGSLVVILNADTGERVQGRVLYTKTDVETIKNLELEPGQVLAQSIQSRYNRFERHERE